MKDNILKNTTPLPLITAYCKYKQIKYCIVPAICDNNIENEIGLFIYKKNNVLHVIDNNINDNEQKVYTVIIYKKNEYPEKGQLLTKTAHVSHIIGYINGEEIED